MSDIHLDIFEDEASLTADRPTGTTVIEESALVIIEHEAEGIQGAAGPTGATGAQGPPGSPGAGSSTRVAIGVAAYVWEHTHNFGAYPAVTALDSINRVVEGLVEYPDNNTVRVTFSVEIAGYLLLN